MKNPVAKFQHKFNKSLVYKDKKKTYVRLKITKGKINESIFR